MRLDLREKMCLLSLFLSLLLTLLSLLLSSLLLYTFIVFFFRGKNWRLFSRVRYDFFHVTWTILYSVTQFRRSRGKLQAAADREALLGGDRSRGDGSTRGLGDGGGNSNSEAAALLRERGNIMNSSNALDEIIGSAENSYSGWCLSS